MVDQAPDPARSYERAKPEAESGMGRLDNNTNATPTKRSDKMEQAVTHRQSSRQINSETEPPPQGPQHAPPGDQPDHSMFDEEPTDWDLAPTDIHNPKHKRHPRKEGKGGTP